MRSIQSTAAFALLLGGVLLVLGSLTLTSCGGTPNPGADAAAAEGHDLFRGTCAMCHGLNGEGRPALGKDLRDNPFTQKLSDDEMVAFLIEGRSANDPLNDRGVEMPPRGGNPALTDADLLSIVAYLRTLQ